MSRTITVGGTYRGLVVTAVNETIAWPNTDPTASTCRVFRNNVLSTQQITIARSTTVVGGFVVSLQPITSAVGDSFRIEVPYAVGTFQGIALAEFDIVASPATAENVLAAAGLTTEQQELLDTIRLNTTKKFTITIT